MASNGGGRRTRGLAPEASARAAALSQLKDLKDKGGRRVDNYLVREEEKIYDSLSEADYNLLVLKRREEVKNFVVADDGLGYADVGEEENWNVDQYSGESDDDDGGTGKKKNASGKMVEISSHLPAFPAPLNVGYGAHSLVMLYVNAAAGVTFCVSTLHLGHSLYPAGYSCVD
jgi:hypothetical protein